MTVNVEVVAIYGALYGIVCSLIFCSFLVVVLSHNWRIVVSMHATILGILVTLLALFQAFGWTVGIVEAISLSILVGNSVDYCIHLSEGYMAADTRHLAFVESFGVCACVCVCSCVRVCVRVCVCACVCVCVCKLAHVMV